MLAKILGGDSLCLAAERVQSYYYYFRQRSAKLWLNNLSTCIMYSFESIGGQPLCKGLKCLECLRLDVLMVAYRVKGHAPMRFCSFFFACMNAG